MKILLAIGAGSFLGGIGRYLISLALNRQEKHFPAGTFAVNVAGCLFIGIFFALIEKGYLNHSWYPFIITGILGGFTTFSAFSLETIHLIKSGFIFHAVLYIVLSIFAGLAATAAGFFIFKML